MPNVSSYPTALGTESGSHEDEGLCVVLSVRVWGSVLASFSNTVNVTAGHFSVPIWIPQVTC